MRVAIVGDIRHSRVARSAWHALRTLGVTDLRIVAPPAFMPGGEEFAGGHPLPRTSSAGLEGADVVMMLRIQKERMGAGRPAGRRALLRTPGDSRQARLRAARPDAIVMHPQPMNRGIEIAAEVADGPQSVIRDQVRNGVAVRMAVLAEALGARGPDA